MQRTTAQEVVQALANLKLAACTLAYGYAVTQKGERVILPGTPPRVVREKRNVNNRCTYQLVRYSDGSEVEFTWSDAGGARYSVA